MAGTLVKVPDMLREWPYPRRLNPHYEQVKAEGLAWINQFRLFDPESQDAFNRCDFAKLAMLAYQDHDLARSRTGANFMTLLYLIDEYTDCETAPSTLSMGEIVMDALRFPHKPRPAGEIPLGEVSRQFWALGRETASPLAERQFLHTMQRYLTAVVQQSDDRGKDYVRTFDEYLELRRDTTACLPSFAMMALDMDFPDEVYECEELERLREGAWRNIAVLNDIYSYHIERARGHALHNSVTIIMHEKDLDPQGAVNWICEWSDGVLKEFIETKNNLLSWGPEIDEQVARYVDGLAFWVRGNDDWTFESERYFGRNGAWVQQNRELYMLPLVEAADARAASHREEVDPETFGIAGMQIRRDLEVAARG
ncbi:terpenoid synthase [Podospora australis]|uniref:Terpene synthase n=1 Tax=Podospora australis TaxID=1536484 RepID=A0AAN6WNB6_9PEZI|nr:terpenoid synthase [Podospora australis]